MKWIDELIEMGFQLPLLIHPTAYVSPTAKIEVGSIVCAKAVINTNVIIEKGSIISIGALVDHDSSLGGFSHINSGAIVKANCRVDRLSRSVCRSAGSRPAGGCPVAVGESPALRRCR